MFPNQWALGSLGLEALRFHFQMGDGGVFEMGGGVSAPITRLSVGWLPGPAE